MGSPQHAPPRIIPHFGQIPENTSKPARSEHWGVFHEDEAGLHFANHTGHLGPESASLSFDARPFSCDADVLARESSAYNVNLSAPRFAVECSHVIPDWEARQDSVSLSLQQDSPAVRFNFDSTNAGISEKDSTKDSSPSSCK